VEKVAEMCKDVLDFSQGRASVRSNGILDFKVIVDQYEKNVFYFWERYDGNASMGRHNTCPELKAFMENVRTCCLWPAASPSSVPSSVRLPCNCPARWAAL
jgi:quinol monooxygenase YgiN